MSDADEKPKQGEANTFSTLLVQSIRNQAMLTILLNAVGELTAHVQQIDAMAAKEALHDRVDVVVKKITNRTFGYPEDYEGEI